MVRFACVKQVIDVKESPAPAQPAPEPPRDTAVPVTADLRRVHYTVSKRFLEKIDRARDALSHSNPGASVEEILEKGLDLILDRSAKRKGLVAKPRKAKDTSLPPVRGSRYVSAEVRRAVWKRDGGTVGATSAAAGRLAAEAEEPPAALRARVGAGVVGPQLARRALEADRRAARARRVLGPLEDRGEPGLEGLEVLVPRVRTEVERQRRANEGAAARLHALAGPERGQGLVAPHRPGLVGEPALPEGAPGGGSPHRGEVAPELLQALHEGGLEGHGRDLARPARAGQEGAMPEDRPPHDFDAMYRAGSVPWDIGGPQPEVVRLLEEGDLVGDVIDVGCGTGENALFLASRGRRVLGVDGSAVAIDLARGKALARGLAVPFLVADALDLARVHRRFETAIDCGLFHVFGPEQRRAYAQSLCEVLSPGSTVHVLCFSDEEPPGPGPYRISESDLRAAFRSIFALMRLRPARLQSRVHEGGARAWLASLTRM